MMQSIIAEERRRRAEQTTTYVACVLHELVPGFVQAINRVLAITSELTCLDVSASENLPTDLPPRMCAHGESRESQLDIPMMLPPDTRSR
jgi:hypothetical protein